MNYLTRRDIYWIPPLALLAGALLSALQPGSWLLGWLEGTVVFAVCFLLLTIATRWAQGGRALAWMVALAFALRFIGGVAAYLALPVNGFSDRDDRAGFVYTDAHRRDDQAWELAQSPLPIMDAFSKTYAYDQYGGLLTFSAFIYRYVSPDAHRPLLLALLAAFAGTLGLPFLWKAATRQWGNQLAVAACWIFALYPEAVLLGGSSLREPYLMAFSAFALWGFVSWHQLEPEKKRSLREQPATLWLGLGIAGMLLVSPVAALATIAILAGWVYFSTERGQLSWWVVAVLVIVFAAGLFVLASALDRQGTLAGGSTPFAVINNFLRGAIKLDVHNLERGSGWVQKLFAAMPRWMRLPFVLIYGILQPVFPAAFIEPTTLTWRVIGIARAAGWYALLPALILSFVAALAAGPEKDRRVWLWISLVVWSWILLTALRGGADQWDNPRYRAILFLWQAILGGHVWVWWRETRSPWVARVLAMEAMLISGFGEWYVNRYYGVGIQLSFGELVALIVCVWLLIFAWGVWRDRVTVRAHQV